MGDPISYLALAAGTPVLSASGATVGTVEEVLQVAEVDVFDGIRVKTPHGSRFLDSSVIGRISTTEVQTTLTDEAAASLPESE